MMIRLGGTLQMKQRMQINERFCSSFFFFINVKDLYGGSFDNLVIFISINIKKNAIFFISMFVRTMSLGINADFLVIVEIILLKL